MGICSVKKKKETLRRLSDLLCLLVSRVRERLVCVARYLQPSGLVFEKEHV